MLRSKCRRAYHYGQIPQVVQGRYVATATGEVIVRQERQTQVVYSCESRSRHDCRGWRQKFRTGNLDIIRSIRVIVVAADRLIDRSQCIGNSFLAGRFYSLPVVAKVGGSPARSAGCVSITADLLLSTTITCNTHTLARRSISCRLSLERA